MKIPIIILFFFIILGVDSIAQNNKNEPTDTLQLDSIKLHSPTKAALFSTALPGLGQVYNKKYWKLPIIYAGIGTSIYFAFSNNKDFKKYKTLYSQRIDGDVSTITPSEYDNFSDANLKSSMDFYQRNRDLSYIVAGLFYVLNIVDAAVDAHLFTFPKNDNLSFTIQPTFQLTQDNQLSKGFSLVIKL